MLKFNDRCVRMAVDLQACQTANSRYRGVGRYSQALFSSIASKCLSSEIFAVVSSQLPKLMNHVAVNPIRKLSLPPLPSWNTARDFNGGNQDTLDSLVYSAFLQTVKPDIVHISHVFEDLSQRVPLPHCGHKSPGQIYSATLYDLIPLHFQEHYFQNDYFKKWYLNRLQWLRQADLLLAVSETSRQDAINMLNIDAERIVTIYGGISEHFRPTNQPTLVRQRLRQKYPLKEKIILYTGGDDFRKNISGLIKGFAAIPLHIRRFAQLIIVCAIETERKKLYYKQGRELGLANDDMLITGYIPEQDLVDLYGICDVFVFPSLYEGLGLPVLEAMACGAPVIGANNSSIKELIVREDALFDPRSASSIADAIIKILTDAALSANLRSYSLLRSKEFTWERSAQLALDAFAKTLDEKHKQSIQFAKNKFLVRKKMAFLSPLPPARSGIADYNAKFLPFLSQYFDIDLYIDNQTVTDDYLKSIFRIYSVKDFEPVAASYDIIFYEFGNSEFHVHMLALLEKFPGIVGLHDAYLSGMFAYCELYLGERERYQREMLYAHGPRARRFFSSKIPNHNTVESSMIALPCTKRVLDGAIGIISHTVFNLEIARKNYQEGWLSPYRIIKQMVSKPLSLTPDANKKLRQEMGYNETDFIISTFGHIIWNKLGDRLLEAFLSLKQHDDKRILLIFVGQLSSDEFGDRLQKAIQNSKYADRIVITNYVSEEEYQNYLRITDIAIQLRLHSRGGTSKAVLDCLVYGVPVIVNEHASNKEYLDDVVIKLEADPSSELIGKKLATLIQNPQLFATYAQAGLQYIKEHHDPAQCAAAYAAAIHEFIERDKFLKSSHFAKACAPYLAECKNQKAINSMENWLVSLTNEIFRRRRLLIDVSHIAKKDHNTGIQKVVKKIVSALYCMERSGLEPIAVVLENGNLVPATSWLKLEGELLSYEMEECVDETLSFKAGDVLLMLDSSWEQYDEFRLVFEKARLTEVPIITTIYDILPLTLETCFVPGGKKWFSKWFHNAIKNSDALVCISKTVANEVLDYARKQGLEDHINKIGYWHLGANLTTELTLPNSVIDEIKSVKYLLMVGTIEPRKSHSLALEAMEKLWSSGFELALCIVGQEGWMSEALMHRLRNHPLRGKKLFLFEKATDAEIAQLYKHATGLLLLSQGEGFGLPIVEAAHYGVPIICTNLPVFQEIAGNFVTYVSLDNSDVLAEKIICWWKNWKEGELPNSQMIPFVTWEQSAQNLLKVILDDHWYWRKHEPSSEI